MVDDETTVGDSEDEAFDDAVLVDVDTMDDDPQAPELATADPVPAE